MEKKIELVSSTSIYNDILSDLGALNAHIGIAYVKKINDSELKPVYAAVFANEQPEYCESNFLGIAYIGLLNSDSQLCDGDIVEISSLKSLKYKITRYERSLFGCHEKVREDIRVSATKSSAPCNYRIDEVLNLQPPHDFRFVYGNKICKTELKALKDLKFEGYKYTPKYQDIYDDYRCQDIEIVGGEVILGISKKMTFYAKMLKDSGSYNESKIFEIALRDQHCGRYISLFQQTNLEIGDFIDLTTLCQVEMYSPYGLVNRYDFQCVYDAKPIDIKNTTLYNEIAEYKLSKVEEIKDKLKQMSFNLDYLLKVFSINAYSHNNINNDDINYHECLQSSQYSQYQTVYLYRYGKENIRAYYDKTGSFMYISYHLSSKLYFNLISMLAKCNYHVLYSKSSKELYMGDKHFDCQHAFVDNDKIIGLYADPFASDIDENGMYLDEEEMCKTETYYWIEIMPYNRKE